MAFLHSSCVVQSVSDKNTDIIASHFDLFLSDAGHNSKHTLAEWTCKLDTFLFS